MPQFGQCFGRDAARIENDEIEVALVEEKQMMDEPIEKEDHPLNEEAVADLTAADASYVYTGYVEDTTQLDMTQVKIVPAEDFNFLVPSNFDADLKKFDTFICQQCFA